MKEAKQLDAYTNHILDMLRNDKRYHLYAVMEGRDMIGIALLFVFENLKMSLLDYMAITPNFQQRGIGRKLFAFTNNEFNRIVPDNIGMLLEVPKENVFDPDELLIRKKRLQFYFRLGVKVLKGVNYFLPVQVDGDAAEEMYLMIKLSKNITSISKKNVIDFINSVYTEVYDCRKNELLCRTITSMPDIIDIGELKVQLS